MLPSNYLTVDQYMNLVRPLIKEQMTTQIVQRESTLSPFMQEVWKREFQFRARSHRDSYIQDKLEYMALNNLIVQQPTAMDRESTVRTLGLMKEARQAREETQRFAFQRRYQIDSQTEKLNKMQHTQLSNADPSNLYWSMLDKGSIALDKVRTQVMENRELDEPLPIDSEMVQLKPMAEQVVKEPEWEPLRQHYRSEGLNCLKSEIPISRLVSERERQKSERKEQLSKIDRALQSEIKKQLHEEVLELPLYLSRNMGLRTQKLKRRPKSQLGTSLQLQQPQLTQPPFQELRINTRSGKRRTSSIKQPKQSQPDEQRDMEAHRITDFIESQMPSPTRHSFWVNKRKQLGYTARQNTRSATRQYDTDVPIVPRNCRGFKFSEINNNSYHI